MPTASSTASASSRSPSAPTATSARCCTLQGVQSITVEHALDNGDPEVQSGVSGAAEPDRQRDRSADQRRPTSAPTPTSFHVTDQGPFADGAASRRRPSADGHGLDPDQRPDLRGHRHAEAALRAGAARAAIRGPSSPAPSTAFRSRSSIRTAPLSGCHDSQSRTGDLLLETGAAYTNLVGVTPDNPAARERRLEARATCSMRRPATPRRASCCTRSRATSPTGFGARMPFGRPKLDQTADRRHPAVDRRRSPGDGWVPGTD